MNFLTLEEQEWLAYIQEDLDKAELLAALIDLQDPPEDEESEID